MIVFFASNMRNVVKSKLLKLLWYADFVAYRRAFKSISGWPIATTTMDLFRWSTKC